MAWTEREEERMDFIFEQAKKGKTAEEIDKLRVQQRELSRQDRGRESEQRVIDALKPIPLITDVVKASGRDDRRGTDLWVSFDPDSNHQDIAVQVKSSWFGYYAFRSRQEKGERRIVIRVGPETSSRTICRTFLAKLRQFDGFI